jgi:hypothetical protein
MVIKMMASSTATALAAALAAAASVLAFSELPDLFVWAGWLAKDFASREINPRHLILSGAEVVSTKAEP